MKVAVMGCVVNGPGESKHANIGISLPGTFEEPKAPVYIDGHLAVTLRGDGIIPGVQANPERLHRPGAMGTPRPKGNWSRLHKLIRAR